MLIPHMDSQFLSHVTLDTNSLEDTPLFAWQMDSGVRLFVVISKVRFYYGTAGNHVTANIYEGKAKSSWTFLITFIIDVRLFSYFHKCNNGLLSTFMYTEKL